MTWTNFNTIIATKRAIMKATAPSLQKTSFDFDNFYAND